MWLKIVVEITRVWLCFSSYVLTFPWMYSSRCTEAQESTPSCNQQKLAKSTLASDNYWMLVENASPAFEKIIHFHYLFSHFAGHIRALQDTQWTESSDCAFQGWIMQWDTRAVIGSLMPGIESITLTWVGRCLKCTCHSVPRYIIQPIIWKVDASKAKKWRYHFFCTTPRYLNIEI